MTGLSSHRWTVMVLVLFTMPSIARAQASGRADGMRFIPDVPGQFRALTERPEALGFHISTTPNPSACRHYQGIARADGPDGTPFFLVTRSGNTPDIPFPCPDDELCCDDSPGEKRNGNLIVFRMDSREKHGERMRSNRLRKGVHVNDTPPPAEDTATIFFTTVEGGLVFGGDDDPLLPNVYQHPGGMQVVGHIMALAMDTPRPFPNGCAPCFLLEDPPPACDPCLNYDRASSPSLVMFFDVTEPEDPIFRSQFVPVDEDSEPLESADGIAVTPLPNDRYLLAVTAGFEPSDPIYFYRSRSLGNCEDPSVDCTLGNPDLSWDFVGKVTNPNSSDDAHQSLHFFREGNINGDLYIAGARGHAEIGPFFEDRDRIDLYQVTGDTPNFEPGETIHLTVRFNGRRLTPRPSTGGDLLASLAAATGFYESPSGELIFYATEHDNDGPSGTVRAGEWRNINMVRENSPTLLPAAVVNGPYTVDEGSTVSLVGSAHPPTTRPWIQLFHKTEFGGPDFATFYPVVDFNDHDLDDFDNFFLLEFQIVSVNPLVLFTHNDKARSWKYFAPQGCSILTLDHHEGVLDETRTLAGTAAVEEDPDLSLVLNDGGTDNIDQEIDAVQFLDDCNAYYQAQVTLHWDIDGNGSFETTGSPVAFDAGALDGPDTVSVPALAQHPFGGAPGTAIATVKVRNVPPAITLFRITDSAGNVVNVDVPFALTGVPLALSAGFTDPGLPDHQTASIAWGDGAVDAQSAFTSFDEAFGDGTGAAAHAHTYASPGTFGIELSLADDDGGTDSEGVSVEVLTPQQAVDQILDKLEDLLATTTDPRVRKDLLKALKALGGSPRGSNGALKMIEIGNNAAAIAFLNQTINELESAQAGGANVGTLIALVRQVIAALSA